MSDSELKAAGDCDVCRLTDWWFCECAEDTDRDNSPADPLSRERHRMIAIPVHSWAQYKTIDEDGTRICHLAGSHPERHPDCPLCAVTPALLADIVTKHGDPSIPRCPMCLSEETYEDRTPHHERIECYCSSCSFNWSQRVARNSPADLRLWQVDGSNHGQGQRWDQAS